MYLVVVDFIYFGSGNYRQLRALPFLPVKGRNSKESFRSTEKFLLSFHSPLTLLHEPYRDLFCSRISFNYRVTDIFLVLFYITYNISFKYNFNSRPLFWILVMWSHRLFHFHFILFFSVSLLSLFCPFTSHSNITLNYTLYLKH